MANMEVGTSTIIMRERRRKGVGPDQQGLDLIDLRLILEGVNLFVEIVGLLWFFSHFDDFLLCLPLSGCGVIIPTKKNDHPNSDE